MNYDPDWQVIQAEAGVTLHLLMGPYHPWQTLITALLQTGGGDIHTVTQTYNIYTLYFYLYFHSITSWREILFLRPTHKKLSFWHKEW